MFNIFSKKKKKNRIIDFTGLANKKNEITSWKKTKQEATPTENGT